MKMHGWGRYPEIDAEVLMPSTVGTLQYSCCDAMVSGLVIPRGLGRSYGDSSLGKSMVSMLRLQHMLSFDDERGLLHCQAGLSLGDILEVFVPRGWFLPVTPGTKHVTVGGAIASDVHGKNHHVDGCFCDHVEYMDVLTGVGEIVRCAPGVHADLFHATCGGMGLTGVILTAAIRLKPVQSAFIQQVTLKASGLEESLEQFDRYAGEPYSVAWIDCISGGDALGRSLLMAGRHADVGALESHIPPKLSVPFDMPSALLNPFSIKAFNMLYYHRVRKLISETTVHYEPFFYPLDSIEKWNRMYGKKGFTQYQFVIPKEAGSNGMKMILRKIVESRKGSFLAVLKAFGKENANLLSFPMEGYTLALDFKIEPGLFALLERIDAMVHDYGGRLYLTKDARMSRETFKRGYSRLDQFQHVRARYGAGARFGSLQSQRLGLDI